MKYVFVDMDGTIAEWGYPDGRIDGEYRFGDYIGKQPINDVIAEIYNLYSDKNEYNVFIISAVPNAKAIIEKNSWLNNFFIVPYENRIYINYGEDKIDIINFYLKEALGVEPRGNSILIDDKKEWLIKGSAIGMEVYHPTKIIGLFQKRMANLRNQEIKEKKIEEGKNTEEVEESIEEEKGK